MPAVRTSSTVERDILSFVGDGVLRWVSAYGKGGKIIQFECLGFICRRGIKTQKGGFVRVFAHSVSAGNGDTESNWIKLQSGEMVLGWWIRAFRTPIPYGIYLLVDDEGLPIIVQPNVRLSEINLD